MNLGFSTFRYLWEVWPHQPQTHMMAGSHIRAISNMHQEGQSLRHYMCDKTADNIVFEPVYDSDAKAFDELNCISCS
jgi:hypothetical protein